MSSPFDQQCFDNGRLEFIINLKPVSGQNKDDVKRAFKENFRKITCTSEYIITSTFFVSIDYFCKYIDRYKFHGSYDIDNIIKPVLDALVGIDGIVLDDCMADRVTVNWIDSVADGRLEISIEYPDFSYTRKSELLILKSSSGWCFPVSSNTLPLAQEMITSHFKVWNSITSENDYYKVLHLLPIQRFVHYNKVKDRGYAFQELL